ncbi:MAG: VWA domain-containing protein [Thermoguttaceae bacterium]
MNDGSWQWEVMHPMWLAALAAALPMIYYARRSLVRLPPWRQAASLCVRLLLLAALVAALCDIRMVGVRRKPYIVAAVDRSASISAAARDKADAFLNELAQHAGGDQMSLLPFAAKPGGGVGKNISPPDPMGTDLAAAVAMARAAIPARYVPRIVLLTDGNETSGDLCAAAQAAGVPISVVPLQGSSDGEVYIASVQAPSQVREGEPFAVDVVVWSACENECRVWLYRGSEPLANRRVHLAAGENRAGFRLSLVGQSAGTLAARVEAVGDVTPENNEAAVTVHVTPPPRALLVASRPGLVETLVRSLCRKNIRTEVLAPNALPDRPDLLQNYDLLVLSNVPAISLSQRQMEAIQNYVRLGGGLIVLGGDHALTPGGYRNTVLEEILPLVCEPNADRPKPTLAMVLVLDCSGSMEGEKMRLVKLATRQAVEALGPQDQVGILAFDERSRWISPLQPCTDKESVLRDIDSVQAGGGTRMYPALEQAYSTLRETSADVKHILLLTDGVSEPGDFASLAEKIADGAIGMSIVGLGGKADRKLLREIAEKSKGQCCFCENAETLPRIFALETRTAAKVGITEAPCFVSAVQANESLAGIDFNRAPALLGHVETRLKPGSRLCLASKSGDPLLATCRCGEGQSAAFTSDLEGRWSAAWLRWEGFGVFWTQLARSVIRPPPAIQAARGESILNYPKELSFRPTNVKLLRWVAQATGGRYAPAPADFLVTAKDVVPWTEAIGPFLLTVALLIFLIASGLKTFSDGK